MESVLLSAYTKACQVSCAYHFFARLSRSIASVIGANLPGPGFRPGDFDARSCCFQCARSRLFEGTLRLRIH